MRKQKLCAEDFFYQLQHTELTAAADTLAGKTQKALVSCQHQSSLPEQSRRFPILTTAVDEQSQGSGRMELPSQPQPHGAPLQTQRRPPYLGGGRAACSPSSKSGDGVPGGNSWLSLPDCPQALRKVLLPLAGCCSLDEFGKGKKTRQGWAQQNQQPEPGAGTRCPPERILPAVQAGSSGRSERNGSTGLLTCIQALLQYLLFPESRRQIVKGRARTCLPHCNVHKKQGGARCAAPDPSAGPCPQQDECCGAPSVLLSQPEETHRKPGHASTCSCWHILPTTCRGCIHEKCSGWGHYR